MSNPRPAPSSSASDLAVQLRRLGKLLASTIERLARAEEQTALTLFIQDELCQHVERLLGYVAEQRQQAQAHFRKADVLGNSTEYEEYRSS